MSNDNLENNIEDDFTLPEEDFNFPDTIEPVSLEIVEEDPETPEEPDVSLDDNIEDSITKMHEVFILGDQAEKFYDTDEDVDNSMLRALASIAEIKNPALLFGSYKEPNPANKVVFEKVKEEVFKKYEDIYSIVCDKINSLLDDALKSSEDVPQYLNDRLAEVRFRSSIFEAKLIIPKGGVINVFTTPFNEVINILESEYALTDNVRSVYKLVDEVLGMGEKSLSEAIAYMEVLYNEWVEMSRTVTKATNTEEDTFRSKLDVLNSRTKVDSFVIATERIVKLFNFFPGGDFLTTLENIIFDEL